uniref:Glutaredoxin domain-containing protein n=1 Tax=Attheya septentrionalis TaxID=420275 RepID=A0A7S2U8V3_9STRA|mmetsp:Transcript_14872/g.26965  ORF Transcript_14872/g.26965 Transcript_14872/m.26965 type:complete len:101 (+) Transcript_14872:62-364(+)
MVNPAEFVKAAIGSSAVVVFSKSWCPYCTTTKNTFRKLNVDAKIIELDSIDNGSDIQSALASLTGQRTVPSVFVHGHHLGGNDDTQHAARSGKLQKMLGM